MLPEAKFHHVGVATDSIEKTFVSFIEAGYNMTNIIFDPIQNVYISFLKRVDSPLLELVEPVDETSPVHNILNKVGVSAYHFCYEVEDLQQSVAKLRKQKFMLIIKPVEAVAFEGRKICFLYNANAGLIELLEK